MIIDADWKPARKQEYTYNDKRKTFTQANIRTEMIYGFDLNEKLKNPGEELGSLGKPLAAMHVRLQSQQVGLLKPFNRRRVVKSANIWKWDRYS